MWSFILTDENYVPLGEILNAKSRSVAKPLSKLDTASLQVRLDNPLGGALMTCSGYLKAYRDGILQFFGPLISAQESGDALGATIAINAVSVGWFMQKRFVGKTSTGQIFGPTPVDRAQIVRQLLDTINGESGPQNKPDFGNTGLSPDSSMSAASAITYTAGPFKKLLDVLNELATAYDGFDWRIDPIENWVNGQVTSSEIGELTAEPSMGSKQSNAIFEWGAGRNNIISYNRTVSRDTQANKVYHYTSNGPDAPGFPTISALDLDSIDDYKLLEELAEADLLDQTLRQQLVNEHVAVRRYPRQIIEFQPHIDPNKTGRVPQFGTDYALGDQVIGRAAFNNIVLFDGYFRVYGVQFDIDEMGTEKTTLTLAEDGSS